MLQLKSETSKKWLIFCMNILSSALIVIQQLMLPIAVEAHQKYPANFYLDNDEIFSALSIDNLDELSILSEAKYTSRLKAYLEKPIIQIEEILINNQKSKCIVVNKNKTQTFFDLENGRVVDNTDLLERDIQTIKFSINNYLWKSKVLKQLDYSLVNQLENILLNYFDVWNQKLNGEVNLAYWTLPQNEGIKIANVSYKLNNKSKQIYYVNSNEYTGYIDKEHYKLSNLIRKSPVNYGIVSSYYDLDRVHPVTKKHKPHLGTDYAAPEGDPIYSVAEGHITEISSDGNNGNHIKINHSKNYDSQYLHMKSFKKGLSKGDFVDKGQVIGYVGSTGLATDSHVCFRLWYKNRQINHIIHKQRAKMDFSK